MSTSARAAARQPWPQGALSRFRRAAPPKTRLQGRLHVLRQRGDAAHRARAAAAQHGAAAVPPAPAAVVTKSDPPKAKVELVPGGKARLTPNGGADAIASQSSGRRDSLP